MAGDSADALLRGDAHAGDRPVVIGLRTYGEHAARAVDSEADADQRLEQRVAALEKRLGTTGGSDVRCGIASPGNPTPLGLFAFAVVSVISGLINLGVLPNDGVDFFMVQGLVLGGIGQFVVGLWEIRRNNTFGGCIFMAFGLFWFGTSLNHILSVTTGSYAAGTGPAVMCVWYVLWGLIGLAFFVQTFHQNYVLSATLAVTVCTFVLLGGGQFDTRVLQASGAFSLCAGSLAFYLGVADLTNEVFGADVLPVLRVHPEQFRAPHPPLGYHHRSITYAGVR